MGDLGAVITSLLVTSGGTLIVAKTDGCYTLDASGQDRELFPFLRYADLPNNGRAWGTFENGLFVAYGNSAGQDRLGPVVDERRARRPVEQHRGHLRAR